MSMPTNAAASGEFNRYHGDVSTIHPEVSKTGIGKPVLDMMVFTLELRESTTGKSRIYLAQESGIWWVQLDGGPTRPEHQLNI